VGARTSASCDLVEEVLAAVTLPPCRPIAVAALSVRHPPCDRRAVIAVGQPAPDAAFVSRDGGVVRLSDLWREKPTILLFLRHFG
jgi:hypothetical protein